MNNYSNLASRNESKLIFRSELPALLPNLNEEIEDTNPMEEDLEKRNLASMARSNMFPRKLRSFDEMRAGGKVNSNPQKSPFFNKRKNFFR